MIDGGYWLCCIQDEQQRTKKDGDTQNGCQKPARHEKTIEGSLSKAVKQ